MSFPQCVHKDRGSAYGRMLREEVQEVESAVADGESFMGCWPSPSMSSILSSTCCKNAALNVLLNLPSC